MKQGRILAITALMVALVVAIFGHWSMPGVGTNTPIQVNAASSSNTIETASQDSTTSSITEVYDAVSPSVVAIRVSTVIGNRVTSSGTGSGFVLDTEGHIATNNHVVDGATEIEIEFFDGTLAWAEIVGVDPDADLAVLKVDLPAEELHPVTFGESDALEVGQEVLAIGSPFGQDWTLTRGIVSGLDRTIQGLNAFSIGGVIQTDAAINPGNSGGPLLDMQGRVIGVNSQIMSTSNSNSGIGFSIPSNLTQRVLSDLIADGKVSYSYIGITGGDMTLSIIDALDLPNDTRGVLVSEVVRGGPADEAGLRSASSTATTRDQPASETVDIITAINGTPLRGMDDLITYLARDTHPGETVTLSIIRDSDQTMEIPLTLGERPEA